MINKFPATLQPLIQQGFLDREFQQAVRSKFGYRSCADRIPVTAKICQAITGTRPGLTDGTTENWSAVINHYAPIIDLEMVTSRIGIASQFLQNAYVNGEQSGRALNELARNALFGFYGLDPSRPRCVENASDLTATDTLTMAILLDGVANLRARGVPEIDGAYNCFLDPFSSRQLFADPDFRAFFTGARSANQIIRAGMVNDILGLRFVPMPEHDVRTHPTSPDLVTRRLIVCGRGALVEADLEGLDAEDTRPADALVSVIDGIAMVTREPIDRLQQIIAQSWYWIGGFGVPVDTEAGPQRAVVIEHVG